MEPVADLESLMVRYQRRSRFSNHAHTTAKCHDSPCGEIALVKEWHGSDCHAIGDAACAVLACIGRPVPLFE